jgi:SAM-dependent methyltransferase
MLNLPCCPFGHDQVLPVAQIPIEDLVNAWRDQFQIDVARLLLEVPGPITYYACRHCGIGFFEPPISGDSAFYEALSSWYDNWRKRTHVTHVTDVKSDYDTAIRYIKSGMRILEIGGARARFSKRFPPDTTYVGLELNEKHVTLLRSEGFDMRLQSIQDHAIEQPGQYDVVCLFQVIEHVVSLPSFVESCIACVKPGGLIIIGCPNANGFLKFQVDNIMNMPPHHLTWWTPDVLRFVASQWNLRVRAIIESSLEPQYERAFGEAFWFRPIRPVLGIGSKFVLTGPRYRAGKLVARILSRLSNFATHATARHIKGHTVTAIYCKQSS